MDVESIRQMSRRLTPNEVCAELLALSVVEYSYSPAAIITVELRAARGRITDTGRGMRLKPDQGFELSHAERALTSFYPCLPSRPEVESVLREHIWHEHGSVGPALANFACASFQFISMREGQAWQQNYRYGTPVAPPKRLGRADTTGTTIDFETTAPIDYDVVAELVDVLTARIPGLHIALRPG
ncbi:hypothetical protein [Burkholderia sp. Bp9142]|uniref:hypothetical protein n=1 Tax=Burkholderia sp. Bp9142 TaxID=2184573 RepID=UPI000F5952C6|nr:hypothetical protein [Burkholderia sp. Bp9142]RQR40637.1 hypothetical protein DIE22_05090 [Burkholderia sp. Bp9142]